MAILDLTPGTHDSEISSDRLNRPQLMKKLGRCHVKPENALDRMRFHAPYWLPILMGFTVEFVELAVNFGGSVQWDQQGNLSVRAFQPEQTLQGSSEVEVATKKVVAALMKLWLSLTMGITASVISLNVWAISVLFTSRRSEQHRGAYAYPTVGFVGHFLAVIAVVALGHLAQGFDAAIPPSSGVWRYAGLWTRVGATLLMGAALYLAWIVRVGVWNTEEKPCQQD